MYYILSMIDEGSGYVRGEGEGERGCNRGFLKKGHFCYPSCNRLVFPDSVLLGFQWTQLSSAMKQVHNCALAWESADHMPHKGVYIAKIGKLLTLHAYGCPVRSG